MPALHRKPLVTCKLQSMLRSHDNNNHELSCLWLWQNYNRVVFFLVFVVKKCFSASFTLIFFNNLTFFFQPDLDSPVSYLTRVLQASRSHTVEAVCACELVVPACMLSPVSWVSPSWRMKWPICWSSPGNKGITFPLQPPDTHTKLYRVLEADMPLTPLLLTRSLSLCICLTLFPFSYFLLVFLFMCFSICFIWGFLQCHSCWQRGAPLVLRLCCCCCT